MSRTLLGDDAAVEVVESDGGYTMKAENAGNKILSLTVDFDGSVNLSISATHPNAVEGMTVTTDIPPHTTDALCQLAPVDETQEWSFTYKVKFVKRIPKPDLAALDNEVATVEGLRRDGESLHEVRMRCAQDDIPFVDVDFPPKPESLNTSDEVVWRRIKDYHSSSSLVLFDADIDPNDINQGALGDCWFLCCLAMLAEFPDGVRSLFKEADHYGVEVTLCVDGWWSDVVIDTYIPCHPESGEPLYARSNGREHWVTLLEKAYAKVKGSYGALIGGNIVNALVDLTGCPCEMIDLQEVKDKEALFARLRRADRLNYLLGAATPGDDDTYTAEKATDEQTLKLKEAGFVPGHAYSIIEVKDFKGSSLLKMRNPWGNFEWKGDWSDSSPQWTCEAKEALGHSAADDGTFWIAFDDFLRYFTTATICHWHPDWNPDEDWFDLRTKGTFVDGYGDVYLCEVAKETSLEVMLFNTTQPGKEEYQYPACGFAVLVADGDEYKAVWVASQRNRVVFSEGTLPVTTTRPHIILPFSCSPSPYVITMMSQHRVRITTAEATAEVVGQCQAMMARWGENAKCQEIVEGVKGYFFFKDRLAVGCVENTLGHEVAVTANYETCEGFAPLGTNASSFPTVGPVRCKPGTVASLGMLLADGDRWAFGYTLSCSAIPRDDAEGQGDPDLHYRIDTQQCVAVSRPSQVNGKDEKRRTEPRGFGATLPPVPPPPPPPANVGGDSVVESETKGGTDRNGKVEKDVSIKDIEEDREEPQQPPRATGAWDGGGAKDGDANPPAEERVSENADAVVEITGDEEETAQQGGAREPEKEHSPQPVASQPTATHAEKGKHEEQQGKGAGKPDERGKGQKQESKKGCCTVQ